jgi:pyridoxine 5'-phosphate synthase PdxJ
MTTRNATICITPSAPESFRVYGTLKTLHGVRVVEIHTGFYASADLKWQACRAENGREWHVSSADRRIDSASYITTRRDAIEAMVLMAATA